MTKPKKPEDKLKAGRPTDYRPEYVAQAVKLCELGATDIELADFFGVATSTLYLWKSKFPKFSEALKLGKDAADQRVERSLYAKATGYTFDSVKIMQNGGEPVIIPYREHVAPDTTAAIFWLKNRRRDEWRDKIDHELAGKDGGAIVQRIERVIVDPKD